MRRLGIVAVGLALVLALATASIFAIWPIAGDAPWESEATSPRPPARPPVRHHKRRQRKSPVSKGEETGYMSQLTTSISIRAAGPEHGLLGLFSQVGPGTQSGLPGAGEPVRQEAAGQVARAG
jgi:hypothetical protein